MTKNNKTLPRQSWTFDATMQMVRTLAKIKHDVQVQDITHVTWRKGGEVLDLHSEERVR